MFNPRVVGATAGVAVLVVLALFITGVIGGSGKSSSTATQATRTIPTTTGVSTTPTPGTPRPQDTTVTVLNGTTVTGLARKAADKLVPLGYPIDKTTDAADQSQQTSQVAYAEGFKDAAGKIARVIGVAPAEVMPIDASTRAVAGNAASVVVTMGADKAR